MHGTTYKANTAYGNLFVTVNNDEHGPFEVFAQLGKVGGFFSAQSEAIGRLISLALRSGVAPKEIINQIKGIRSTEVAFSDGEIVYSLPDAIAKVLEKHLNRNQQELQLEFSQGKAAENAAALSAEESAQIVRAPALSQAKAAANTVSQTEAVVAAIAVQHTAAESHAGSAAAAEKKPSIANMGYAPVCPNCSMTLIMEEGCMKCNGCGYSKCG